MYKKIAEKMYELLVINNSAAAIQQEDGRYITKYFHLSSFIIEEMLRQHGSMGCYQQGYKTDKIKWICFDFDCVNKENPDVMKLYVNHVKPFIAALNELCISYLTEFSGRRGIHVWICFNSIISKSTGYKILKKLKDYNRAASLDSDVNVDYYPAVEHSRGNKVGKQVKFPLSCHKSGKRSYFFSGDFKYIKDSESDDFLKTQLQILENYITNSVDDVIKKLELSDEDINITNYKYKQYRLIGDINIPLERIEEILSKTQVYKQIYTRMKKGVPRREDWLVLLGTLSGCDNNCEIVRELFSTFPNYDVQKTLRNIDKLKDRYFPATFNYLYELYDIKPEIGINLDETGFQYLLREAGCLGSVLEKAAKFNEYINIDHIQYTIQKEKKYLIDNDEVPDVMIWNRLNSIKPYDIKLLKDKVTKIKKHNWKKCVALNDIIIHIREEIDGKTRKMVSLSETDRVLTTHLILALNSKMKNFWHSYSYNISPCSKDQIFYAWYSSWMNYITNIQTYLEIPFFKSYHVFVMDLKGFYDHIDFLAVYQVFEETLDDESKNIMKFLIAYNELVMRKINGESRIGVPQGPAYARVIAEFFLDYILQSVFKKYNEEEFFYYRYVDDIIVYYKPDFAGSQLYDELENTLLSYGLPLNQEKSGILGSIENLTEKEKSLITHKNKFSYDLNMSESSVIFEEEQNRRIRMYMQNNEFDISALSYIFGSRTMPKAANEYYEEYAEQIFEEYRGRGSHYKRFYEFLFSNEDLVKQALERDYISKIPIDSLNFSNFIHCLYFAVQNKRITKDAFDAIKNNYLVDIAEKITNERDRSVAMALLL